MAVLSGGDDLERDSMIPEAMLGPSTLLIHSESLPGDLFESEIHIGESRESCQYLFPKLVLANCSLTECRTGLHLEKIRFKHFDLRLLCLVVDGLSCCGSLYSHLVYVAVLVLVYLGLLVTNSASTSKPSYLYKPF